MKTIVVLALAAVALAACAHRTEYASVYPEQNPKGGVSQAYEICRAKSKSVSGYDWIDSMSRQSNALDACMLEYGYRLQRVPNT